MGLTDFAGVFSRAFVVGYFLPSFFCLMALRLIVDKESVPELFAKESAATEVLIVGGLAILLGLLLSGLNRALVQLLEGYPLQSGRGPLRWWGDRRTAKWQREFQRLENVRKVPRPSPQRTEAALTRYSRFPHKKKDVLPTEFGNVVRSFETHPAERYGLDGVPFWPRVELLLDDGEREVITDAQTNLNFFVNTFYGILVLAGLLIADRVDHAADSRQAAWQIALILGLALIGGLGTYRLAISVAGEWGEVVRAAFDLHRHDVYAKLGLKAPPSPQQEHELGVAISRSMLFAEPIDAKFRAPPSSD